MVDVMLTACAPEAPEPVSFSSFYRRRYTLQRPGVVWRRKAHSSARKIQRSGRTDKHLLVSLVPRTRKVIFAGMMNAGLALGSECLVLR